MTAPLATQIVDICREVLEDPTVTLESTTATVKTWDSLGHMNLITALESHFSIELDVMEMAAVDGVRALVDTVAAAVQHAGSLRGSGA